MLPTIFLDTNTINSNSLLYLFGCQEKLERLSRTAKIVIPQVVFDELLEHKKRYFVEQKAKFSQNALMPHLDIDRDIVNRLSLDELITQIVEREKIPYITWDLSDYSGAFREAYRLAINNLPPFHEGSDKGFKDTCVALSVIDYLDTNQDIEQAYLITNDNRLRTFFLEEARITTLENIDDAIRAVAPSIAIAADASPGSDGSIATKEEKGDGVAPDGECLDLEELTATINALCNSSCFQDTHSLIARLESNINHIKASQGVRLLKAALHNQQIGWILSDDDVKSFFAVLLQQFGFLLNSDEYSEFVDKAELPNDRLDNMGQPTFSKAERETYLAFVDGLISNIESRGWMSTICTDAQEVLPGLQQQINLASLDPNATSWLTLAHVFIQGSVKASARDFDLKKARRFVALLEQSSPAKQSAMMMAIASRLGNVEIEYDDIPF